MFRTYLHYMRLIRKVRFIVVLILAWIIAPFNMFCGSFALHAIDTVLLLKSPFDSYENNSKLDLDSYWSIYIS
jgi:hypothetical protein